MTSLEQELTDLRNAIKEMKTLRERVERMDLLAGLKASNPAVAKYFQIAMLLDGAAVREVLSEIRTKVLVEIGWETSDYLCGKLIVDKAAVADITINKRFSYEAEIGLQAFGIPTIDSIPF